ncbi:hypothetical protein BBJ28_00022651 [Nothophytophthora sp. Chile5]|nr:hypothetical protein BBJ28_00022651 [Nothophytophthora sp. Chile5]
MRTTPSVQQELAREQQRSSNQDDDKKEEEGRGLTQDARFSYMDDDGDDASYSGPPRASMWEEKVESSAEIHDVWVHKIDQMLQSLDTRPSSRGRRGAKESTHAYQDASKDKAHRKQR